MRTVLSDGHCQSQRPRRPAALAHPLRDGKENSEHRGFWLAPIAASPQSRRPPPAASGALPPRRALVGRGTGDKTKKNRPIQNPSLPSLVGTAPVRPGRATRQFAPARPSAPARSSSPAHRRTALAPSSAPAPPSSPAHCRMDAANRSAQGAPAPLAHPLRDGKENSEQRGFWLAPIAASPQSRHPPPAASGATPPRRALVGRGAGGKPKKNRPIQNPSLPSLVGTAPVRPGRTARRFAPARPSAPARSSSPAHRRTALAPSSAPAPSLNPLAGRMDAANRSAQGAPAALAHPLRDGKEHSERRGFWLSPAVASPQSRRPPPAASGALPPRRAWVRRGAGGKPKKNRPIQNPSLPSLVGTAPVRPGQAARQFAPARPSAPARSSSPAHRRTALAPSSAPAPSPSPLAAGWTPPIAAPKAACAAGPSLAGWEGKFGTPRISAAPPCSRHHLPPPAASGAPPHVPAFSGAAPVLSTVFHRVTSFSASARRAPLLPCAGGCVHAAPSSPSAESTAPRTGKPNRPVSSR